jgi:hypothetical protein
MEVDVLEIQLPCIQSMQACMHAAYIYGFRFSLTDSTAGRTSPGLPQAFERRLDRVFRDVFLINREINSPFRYLLFFGVYI